MQSDISLFEWIAILMLFLLSKVIDLKYCVHLPLQHHRNRDMDVDVEGKLSRLTRMKSRLVSSIRAVLQLVSVGAALRETARLPQVATVISTATTSSLAVMTSKKLAASVRAHQKKNSHSVAVWFGLSCVFVDSY